MGERKHFALPALLGWMAIAILLSINTDRRSRGCPTRHSDANSDFHRFAYKNTEADISPTRRLPQALNTPSSTDNLHSYPPTSNSTPTPTSLGRYDLETFTRPCQIQILGAAHARRLLRSTSIPESDGVLWSVTPLAPLPSHLPDSRAASYRRKSQKTHQRRGDLAVTGGDEHHEQKRQDAISFDNFAISNTSSRYFPTIRTIEHESTTSMLDGQGVFPLAISQTYATSAIQIRKKNSGFLAAVTITRTRGPLGSPDALRRAINLVALIVSSGHSDIVSSGHSDPRRGTHRLLQPERILPVASAQPVTEYTLPRPLCRQGTVRQTRDTTRRISSLQTNESGLPGINIRSLVHFLFLRAGFGMIILPFGTTTRPPVPFLPNAVEPVLIVLPNQDDPHYTVTNDGRTLQLSLDTTLPGESRFCISLNPSTEWSLAYSLYGSPCGNESQQSEHSPRTHLKALDHFYTSFPQWPPTMAPFPPNFRSPSPGKPYCSCSDLPFGPSPASIDQNVDLHGGSPLSWGNTVPATSPSIMPGGFYCNDNVVDNEAEGRRPQGPFRGPGGDRLHVDLHGDSPLSQQPNSDSRDLLQSISPNTTTFLRENCLLQQIPGPPANGGDMPTFGPAPLPTISSAAVFLDGTRQGGAPSIASMTEGSQIKLCGISDSTLLLDCGVPGNCQRTPGPEQGCPIGLTGPCSGTGRLCRLDKTFGLSGFGQKNGSGFEGPRLGFLAGPQPLSDNTCQGGSLRPDRRHGTDVPGGALSEDILLEQSSGRPDGRKLLDHRVHWMDEVPNRSDGWFAMEQCTRLVDGTPQPIFLDSYGRRTVTVTPWPALYQHGGGPPTATWHHLQRRAQRAPETYSLPTATVHGAMIDASLQRMVHEGLLQLGRRNDLPSAVLLTSSSPSASGAQACAPSLPTSITEWLSANANLVLQAYHPGRPPSEERLLRW